MIRPSALVRHEVGRRSKEQPLIDKNLPVWGAEWRKRGQIEQGGFTGKRRSVFPAEQNCLAASSIRVDRDRVA